MSLMLTYLVSSTAVLAVLVLLFIIEDSHGSRICLRSIRSFLDNVVIGIGSLYTKSVRVYGQGFIRTMVHYGVHTLLRFVLNILRKIETRVAHLLRQNKAVARNVNGQRERNHLDAIADHKEDSALSEKEKKRIRSL